MDLGAGDGVEKSNSLAFEEKLGWTGLLIEPMPAAFRELQKNRPKAKTVRACVAGATGGHRKCLPLPNPTQPQPQPPLPTPQPPTPQPPNPQPTLSTLQPPTPPTSGHGSHPVAPFWRGGTPMYQL